MPQKFHTFSDIQAHLDNLGLFHVDLGLGRMERALAALRLTRPPFLVVQILGTNGKGSTSTFLSSLGQAHGCTVGLYTSPHFVCPTERIRINGRALSGDAWVDAANRIMAVAPDLTYFEFLTVLAVVLFADHHVDIAVLEAGLGGHHDATTAIACDCCCFTPIAMDHADILGPTIANIADDKAHAIRTPAPVFSAGQFPAVADILTQHAQQRQAPFTTVTELPPYVQNTDLGLAGEHQQTNASLALAAWQFLATKLGKTPSNTEAIRRGLAHAFVPGRLQSVAATMSTPALLLDGAHNPHGTRSLVRHLATKQIHPCACVYSCLHDKDWHASLGMLAKVLDGVPFYIPGIDNPRAEDPATVAEFYNRVCGQQDCAKGIALTRRGSRAVEEALQTAAAQYIPGGGPVLVCGSLYLLAEVFALHPEFLEQ